MSRVGRKPRLDAASESASRALTLIGAEKPSADAARSNRNAMSPAFPALAHHLDDRALACFRHAPALEQLDERALGRGAVGKRVRRQDGPRGGQDQNKGAIEIITGPC